MCLRSRLVRLIHPNGSVGNPLLVGIEVQDATDHYTVRRETSRILEGMRDFSRCSIRFLHGMNVFFFRSIFSSDDHTVSSHCGEICKYCAMVGCLLYSCTPKVMYDHGSNTLSVASRGISGL